MNQQFFDEMSILISIMFKCVYHAMKQAIVDDTKYTLIKKQLVLSWNEMLFTKINLVSLFIHKARVH
jgi:hypothetical protein